jgi:hypothetical protein
MPSTVTQKVGDPHPTACSACAPGTAAAEDQDAPFHETASSPPRHTAIQNDGPAHDNDGPPDAPEAPPVWVAPPHLPSAKWYASPLLASATHESVAGHSTAPMGAPRETLSGTDQFFGRTDTRVVEVGCPAVLVEDPGSEVEPPTALGLEHPPRNPTIAAMVATANAVRPPRNRTSTTGRPPTVDPPAGGLSVPTTRVSARRCRRALRGRRGSRGTP